MAKRNSLWQSFWNRMTNNEKHLNDLTKSFIEGDLTKKYETLRELAIYKDVSTIPALEQVLFSEDLQTYQTQLESEARQQTDNRAKVATAYVLYEINVLRYEIVKLLEEIGTAEALRIVEKWELQEQNKG